MPWNKGPWPRLQGQDGLRMLRRKRSKGGVGERPLRNTVGEVIIRPRMRDASLGHQPSGDTESGYVRLKERARRRAGG